MGQFFYVKLDNTIFDVIYNSMLPYSILPHSAILPATALMSHYFLLLKFVGEYSSQQ